MCLGGHSVKCPYRDSFLFESIGNFHLNSIIKNERKEAGTNVEKPKHSL